ncbi:MAG TPA: metallophosphoesterase, partial [Puia sp.]|nr:metallophosphoesterase [Puia sp.]
MHKGGLTRILLYFAAVSLLLDWYVYNGLKTLSKGWRSKRLRRTVRIGYLVIALGVTLLFFIGLGSFRTAQGMTPYHEWVLSLFLAFLITKIFFALILFLGDSGRLLYGIVSALVRWRKKIGGQPGSGSQPLIPSRRRFISEAAVLVAAVPFTAFLYAMVRGKYDYRVHRETLFFDDLPPAFDGFTITQVSDIHSGSFDNTAAVRRGIELAQSQKSDLFVFTGDLVNNAAWEIEPYISHFS